MKHKALFTMIFLILTSCARPPALTSTGAQIQDTPTPLQTTPTVDISVHGIWIQRASMLTQRSENPAVELNGLIYVPGGFGLRRDGLANGKGDVAAFDVYNPVTDQWTALTPMPESRHHSMATSYNGRIYVFGGFVDPWITYDNVWVYEPENDHWMVLNPMPASRTAGAAVTLGDYIYLIGGTTSKSGVILPTWRYDPENDAWMDVAPLQEPREHNCAVILNGQIYALGGRWFNDLKSVEIYDPISDEWIFGPGMQEARAGFGATVLDGRIYAAGGEMISKSKTLDSVEVFDPKVGDWSLLPELPNGLHGAPLASADGMIYIMGGSARAGDVINWGKVFAYRP